VGTTNSEVEARKRAHLIIEGPTQKSRWKIKVLSGFFMKLGKGGRISP
jgi:hypothetical protein